MRNFLGVTDEVLIGLNCNFQILDIDFGFKNTHVKINIILEF